MISILLLLSFSFAEQPKYISDEGVYYYNQKKQTDKKIRTKRGEKVYKDDSGAYHYNADDIDKKDIEKKRYGKPIRKKGNTSYFARIESEQTKSTTVQIVNLKFEDFKSGTTYFEDVYSSANGVLLDFEWQKRSSLAKFGLILSSGIFVASGNGQFASGGEALEEYDMYIIPLIGKVRINLEYADRQYIVPYIEGGAGAYGIYERRDDGDDSNYAYTPILTAAGGLNFLLDWINEGSVSKLDNNYGINHIWLNVSYHIISATDSDFDLSSNQIQAGFKFDY